MKKMINLAAVATIVVLCTVFVGCDTASDFGEAPKKEEPKNDPTPNTPDPDPETTDWRWSIVGDQTLDFFVDTEIVEAKNIGQLTRLYNGKPETKLDSVMLKYQLGVELNAPTRIVVFQKDTTVAGFAHTNDNRSYGEYVVSTRDSVCSVSTEHNFPTQYYDIAATTTSKRGYSLHAGHWEAFKYVTESARWSKIWHEPLTEITINDSVFNREIVHNGLTFVIKSNKGNVWYINREIVVIVDHFLRMKEKEGEKKEEKVTADEWIKGLGRLVSLTKCLREDSRLWCDVALLEGGDGYTMIIDTYNTDGGFVGREKKFVSFEVCPKSNDYDGVAYINGGFYPAAITYDSSSRGWVLVSVVNGNVKDQSIDARDAASRGIKNFKENNTAYPWPYMTNTSTSKEVNGKKVITILGKTSTRSYRGCVVADSSLKK